MFLNQEQAKEIMSKNMLGIEDVTKHFGVTFLNKQLNHLVEVPFSEVMLRECKDTHILFPGYPLTVVEIRERVPLIDFYGRGWDKEDVWWKKTNYAGKEKVACRWYLIRRNEVSGSFGKEFEEQKQLLEDNEEVPRTCEMVFMIILYERVTGVRLFLNVYVHCRDQDFAGIGDYPFVGHFQRGFTSPGLGIKGWFEHFRSRHDLGIAASRKCV